MTVGGFRGVDHDLLADYLGGALDGTPQEAAVARLVAEDAAWAEAYTLLAPAVAGVRADLAGWGEPAVELPSALADQITAALAALPPPDPTARLAGDEHVEADGTVPEAPAPAAVEPTPAAIPDRTPATEEADQDGRDAVPAGAGPRLVPTQGGPGRRRPNNGTPPSEPGRGARNGPGRRQRRWGRIAGPVAVAAVSLAAVGLGVNQLAPGRQDGGADTALNQPASAPDEAGGVTRTIAPPLRSGTNYTPQTLGVPGASTEVRPLGSAAPGEQPRVDGDGGRLPAPDGLDRLARLTDQSALSTCLNEISVEHGAGALVVELVDYAAFQGEQALVVRFADSTGARWAWVTGPECGVPGSGADTRYRTRVG
ncbi:hypothetical protein AB0C04_00850 [Micromonospora sp. NPDC048909]|uniref:hypothetical protein n=1 Tax=Micromonospora sp. NPDC048909 TaxID=3155643 RepID=UPI0033E0C00B